MKPQPYNFHKPASLTRNLERSLEQWLRVACTLATRKGERELPLRLELSLVEFDIRRRDVSLSRLPEAVVSHWVALDAGLRGLLVLPRPLVLALVAGVLGGAGEKLPEDRELTAVELSLYDYWLQQFLLPSLQETWPGQVAARVELVEPEPNPRWTRTFPATEPLIVAVFRFAGPFGEQVASWLLPCKPLLGLLAPGAAREEARQGTEPRKLLEAHVRDLSVVVTVPLGTLELQLAQVGRLQEGDVLVLDQCVDVPLPALVDGKKTFRVWCGRVGSRHAFQVESVVES